MGSSFAVPAPNPLEVSPLATVSIAMSWAALSSSLAFPVFGANNGRTRVTKESGMEYMNIAKAGAHSEDAVEVYSAEVHRELYCVPRTTLLGRWSISLGLANSTAAVSVRRQRVERGSGAAT
eukprot:g5403.t1